MIKSISIRNFALIQESDINFKGGFTVITGETGSGKSILLNSLALVLGDRADFSLIGTNGDKAIVEVVIDVNGFDLNSFFESNELDYFDETIIRREVSKQGRSRAFINDIPVQLHLLRELVGQMVQIHSQYNTLELKDKEYQLELYDTLAGTISSRKKFEKAYHSLKQLELELEHKESELAEKLSNQDYNAFQLEEIESLNLEKTDFLELSDKLKSVESIQYLHDHIHNLTEILSEGDVTKLHSIKKALLNSESYSIKEIGERLESILIELAEIERDASTLADGGDFSPDEMEEMRRKLDDYLRIMTKHRLNDQSELLQLRESLSKGESDSQELNEKITALKSQIESLSSELELKAKDLHEIRISKKNEIASELKLLIDDLKLENTVVEFRFTKLDSLNKTGFDELQLYFSPNPGKEPVPVHKAASGGELSRVMLALQNMLSRKAKLKTILFDEIDTGVSGDVAQKVGQVLKSMGQGMQVIAITHLPQVAAKGTQHFKVIKSSDVNSTLTTVNELDYDHRIVEIARLMSGESINEGALLNAKALMN